MPFITKIIPKPIEKLINEFSKLPGIGLKSAQRLTFYLLKCSKEDLKSFAKTIEELKENVVFCSVCQNLAQNNPCIICQNNKRERSLLCVVEESLDVMAIEQTGEYKGLYHVLHGAISPINGIGPDDLKIKELLFRLKNNNENKISEIILATNPNIEGEATAMYLARFIRPLGIKVTRIARGLPTGSDLEYADELTLSNALKGRKEY